MFLDRCTQCVVSGSANLFSELFLLIYTSASAVFDRCTWCAILF